MKKLGLERTGTNLTRREQTLKQATAPKISGSLQHSGRTARDLTSRWAWIIAGRQVQTIAGLARKLQLISTHGRTESGRRSLITATLRIRVSKGKKEDVVGILRSLIGPTRAKTGCLSCRLYQDVNDEFTVTWMEQWRSQDDLNRHVRTPQYKRILAALDMSNVQPEIKFDTVVETKGMQLIEEALGANTQN
jgi:quinol monooxygenase YgiN